MNDYMNKQSNKNYLWYSPSVVLQNFKLTIFPGLMTTSRENNCNTKGLFDLTVISYTYTS